MKKFNLTLNWFAIVLFMAITINLSAQPSGWTRYQVFQITNTGSTLTNYQLKMTLNTQTLVSQGYMDATGKDIRFGLDLPGSTLYNYWIESGMNTSTTVIWVKINSIPAGNSLLYWFYSNPSATPVTAISGTFFGPNAASDSVTGGATNTVSNCQRGPRFSISRDVLVTDLGKRIPNATPRFVTIFNFTTTSKVVQTTVPAGTANQYNYNTLSKPIWLSKDTVYLLELHNASGDMYYYSLPTTMGQFFTYLDMRYCNSCDQNTFPTSSLTGQNYGIPDLLYWYKNEATPAPTYLNITDINNFASNTAVYIYPNPTSGPVNFILPGKVNVTVYDKLGKQVLQTEFSDNNAVIDLNGFENGIYFIKLVNGSKQDVVKITKIN